VHGLVDVLSAHDGVLQTAEQVLQPNHALDESAGWLAVGGLKEFDGIAQTLGANPNRVELARRGMLVELVGALLERFVGRVQQARGVPVQRRRCL
jgi:hypothetical protein